MNTSVVQAAGTAGETHINLVLSYLERLTGAPVATQTSLTLRSVHRAAFTSWARKQNIPIHAALMNAGNCTVGQLLGLEANASAEPLPLLDARRTAAPNAAPALLPGEIGIDVEEVESIPHASDYREHPFFQDHFTPAEIAYCIRQPQPQVSFCGLWAAKEAMLKAGLIPAASQKMSAFEITHDSSGRPTFPGCRLSISHTPRFAVAVCLAG